MEAEQRRLDEGAGARPPEGFAEPARPRWIARRPDAWRLSVAAVCVGAFMGQLDASIVTLALPTLRRDLDASLGGVEWVALAYLLVLVSTVVVVGRIADAIGRKLLYLVGFAVFTGASLGCALAPDLGVLIGARLVQGLGAALLQANSVALIAASAPPRSLSRALGVQGTAQAVGLALGPSLGGALIALGGWRLIFLVNLPAGAVGLTLGWLLLPRSRDLRRGEPFDVAGAALLVIAAGALLGALSLGQVLGWGAPGSLIALLAAPCLIAALIVRERRSQSPLLDLDELASAGLLTALGAGLLAAAVLFGVLFVVPFYLEAGRGEGAVRAGLELSLLPVSLGVVALFAGRLTERVGRRRLTTGALLLVAAALGVAASVRGGTGPRICELIALGVGLGAFTPANNSGVMQATARSLAGVAGGALNMARGLGTAIGVAVAAAAFSLASGAATAERAPIALSAAERGFGAATACLAGLALAGAALSAMRPLGDRGRLSREAGET